MNKLRSILRERTREAHERLDGLFSRLDLKQRGDYTRFLAAQAAVLGAVEKRLDAAGAEAVIPEWSERRRSDEIRRDLETLGETPEGDAPEADWIADRASIIGAAYVLEGSRLGGKILVRDALQSPDAAVARATRFLGHGEGRKFWGSFDALLGATELDAAETDRMVESAVRTFEAFEQSARRAMAPPPLLSKL